MADAPPTDTKSLIARLPGVAAFELTLGDRKMLGPHLVEVVLNGDLANLSPAPGNDVMLAVPVEGGDGSFRRRYTILSSDDSSITLWIDTSAEGPGSRWASTAPIGSAIEAVGPRGKVTTDEMADWHLFIGDLSFLAAATAMATAIEAPGQAIFILEVDDPDDAVAPHLDEGIGLTFCVIERDGRGLDDAAGLLAGLAAIELPDDKGSCYVGGELGVVATIKQALRQRGLRDDAISAKPYWRLGVSNLAHGEPRKD
jgi:NADPH-dependent ferric siderophore reductase